METINKKSGWQQGNSLRRIDGFDCAISGNLTAGKLRVMKTIHFLILFCLAVTTTPTFAKTPGEVAVRGTLREATMQGLNGPSRKLSDFRGKPLIINVWASWCGPCREEMGSLERLSRHDGGSKFAMIGISTDDYPEAAKAFLQKSGTTFSHFIDSKLLLENMLGADRLPLTLLVDAKGRVLAKFYGAKVWDSPEALEVIGKAFRILK
ncbi:MAG: TlpA disulfide reductase family protein [Georgfuchsia sp.]